MHATAFLFGLIVEPDTNDMNVGCRLCIHVHNYLLLGLATIALGVMGFAPLQCDLSVLVKLQAASSLFTRRLRTQGHTDSQQEQLQRAGHEPVCLVPDSVDQYLPVPDCTLQQSLDIHSEGLLLC
jgi:hypothetical protein